MRLRTSYLHGSIGGCISWMALLRQSCAAFVRTSKGLQPVTSNIRAWCHCFRLLQPDARDQLGPLKTSAVAALTLRARPVFCRGEVFDRVEVLLGSWDRKSCSHRVLRFPA